MKLSTILEQVDNKNPQVTPLADKRLQAKLFTIKWKLIKILNIMKKEDPDLVGIGYCGGSGVTLMFDWAQTQGESFIYLRKDPVYWKLPVKEFADLRLSPVEWSGSAKGHMPVILVDKKHPNAVHLYSLFKSIVYDIEKLTADVSFRAWKYLTPL